MSVRRSTFEMKVTLLRLAVNPIKPTNLMYQANMAWGAMKPMLNKLVEMGAIEKLPAPGLSKRVDRPVPDMRSRYVYRTTNLGMQILESVENSTKKLNS